jgi:hypothetical protein
MIIIAWILLVISVLAVILDLKSVLGDIKLRNRVISFISLLINGVMAIFYYIYLFK